jgi:hypothetical protein
MTNPEQSYHAGDCVRRADTSAGKATPEGTIAHVFSRDWAAMVDEDVSVDWDGAGRTSEPIAALELVNAR